MLFNFYINKYYIISFLLVSFLISEDTCFYETKILIDGSKYKDKISYLTVPVLNGEFPEIQNGKVLVKILNESLESNCLNFFSSSDKKSNFNSKILYKYVNKKLGSSKASNIKSKLKNNDVLCLIEISKTSIKIELYNNRLDLLANYNKRNISESIDVSILKKTLNKFYDDYFFTKININKDNKMLSDDMLIMNGKHIGSVGKYTLENNQSILIDKIPKNIKSYIQIESNVEDRISEKYLIDPVAFYLKKKNKRNRSEIIESPVDFEYRNKVGSFKLNLLSGNGMKINDINSNVKLYNFSNVSGVNTELVNIDNYILVSTDQKFHKNWKYLGTANIDQYPKPFPKIVTLVDTSSYKLHSNPEINFNFTKTSKPKTYAYNILLPGISGFLVSNDNIIQGKSFFDNSKIISGLTISTYILSAFSVVSNYNDYNNFSDNYKKNLLSYNTTGQSVYKNLTTSYYNKAIKSEKNYQLFSFLALSINILSNYYISSKWFTWD